MPHPTDTTWMPMPLNAVQNAKETYISDVAYILSISTFSLVIFSALREKLFCHIGVSKNKYFSYKLQYFFGALTPHALGHFH